MIVMLSICIYSVFYQGSSVSGCRTHALTDPPDHSARHLLAGEGQDSADPASQLLARTSFPATLVHFVLIYTPEYYMECSWGMLWLFSLSSIT